MNQSLEGNLTYDFTLDRIAIQDVMLRYATGVDEKDFTLYRSCFIDDVEVVDFGPQPVHGADNWLYHVENAINKFRSTQHMLCPTYAVIDGDVAETRTDVQALHCPVDEAESNFILWATYKTRMVRSDTGWKIQHHRLVTRSSRRDKD